MTWLPKFSKKAEQRQQARIQSERDTVLQVEQLETRTLLAAEPLLIDINTGGGAYPREITEVNGNLFFVANDGTSGNELWKSDGTSGGTVLVKNIYGGNSDPEFFRSLTNMDGTLFFLARQGASGYELWKSDGTTGGTVIVKDINGSGTGSHQFLNSDSYRDLSYDSLFPVNGTLFFRAGDGSGQELWKSDGTEGGTVLVKNLAPGGASSDPQMMTNVDGTLFFTANDGSGIGLWKTDGTAGGTVLLKNLSSSDYDHNFDSENVNGTLFFSTQARELWASDGTYAGTQIIKLFSQSNYSPTNLTNIEGTLFFSGHTTTQGFELWKSDGTSMGTELVKDIRTEYGIGSIPSNLTNYDGTLFFQANDGTLGYELWTSDGTSAGTQIVQDIAPNSSSPQFLTVFDNTLFFQANGLSGGVQLWTYDGTSAGVMPFFDSNAEVVQNPRYLTNANGTLFFTSGAPIGGLGQELWISDGTCAGTMLVKNLFEGGLDSVPEFFTDVNGTLFFRATGETAGFELWRSDGTIDGTNLVKDIIPGLRGSNPIDLVNVNGTLFFSAESPSLGRELWKSDGTPGGTQVVKDLVKDEGSSNPYQLANINGTLFFVADDGSYGFELWKSDGTSNGTQMVKNIHSAEYLPGFDQFTNVNGTLYFVKDSGNFTQQLWRTTGTGGGTVMLRESIMNGEEQKFRFLNNLNGQLVFVANDGFSGYELWKSNGTSQGTVLVKDVHAGSPGAFQDTYYISDATSLKNLNGTLFFRANDGVNGYELWKTDGSYDGTSRVTQLKPGGAGSLLNDFAEVDGSLFFRTNDVTESSLWKTDGTSEGTVLIKSLNRSPAPYQVDRVEAIQGTLYFVAWNASMGRELWRSDGTSEGTVLVKELLDDPNEHPNLLNQVDGTLFYRADDGFHGIELWSLDATVPTLEITPDGGMTTSSPILFTFQFSEEIFDFTVSDVMITNGTAGTFTAVDGDTYTLQVTPTADGDVTVSVAEGGAVDADLHDSKADSATILYDVETPSLEITPDGTYEDASPILFTFEFSENVSGFVKGDISVSNGTAGTFTAIDGNTYTLEVAPTSEGDVVISVADGVAQDSAGKTNLGDMATVVYDITPPSLQITPDGTYEDASPILFTFEFTEDVNGFVKGDISVTNGTAGTFTAVDGNTYTLEVAPTAEGEVIVTVVSGVAQDDSGKDNIGDITSVIYDITPPSLEITPDGTFTENSLITFTFEFSEDVNGFDTGDIVVTNGTKGTFTAVDGNTYTLEVTADAEGEVIATVADAVAQDDSGKDNVGDSATVVYDITPPSLQITPDGTYEDASPILFTFEFTEDVNDFDASDIVVTNGTKGTFTAVDGNTYTLEVAPTAEGEVTVTVADAVAQDDSGKDNLGDMASVIYDITPPSLEITPDGTFTENPLITFTFEFSEDVNGFDTGDIVVTNGTKGTFTAVDGNTYTLEVTADAEGEVIATVADAVAQDDSGKDNVGDSATVVYDITPPSLQITPDGTYEDASPILFTFEFTEDVNGFVKGDISVTNGTAGTYTAVDGNTYTLAVTPTAEGEVTVTVADAVAQDDSGKDNLGDMASVIYDITPPSLAITPDGTLTNSEPILFTFEFTEDVNGFVKGDIMVTNGTAGTFTVIDGDSYTLVVTPTADGDVVVTVADGVAQDDSGKDNLGDMATVTYDSTPPTVEITPDQLVTGTNPIIFTFEFSEEIVGFTLGDISVTNGTVGEFVMVDEDTYTLEVFPVEDGEVTVSVADATATDLATNPLIGSSATIESDRFQEKPLIVTGADAGIPATVRVFAPNGSEQFTFAPYGAQFIGGVRVAMGDINGDGIMDIVTAPGAGHSPEIRVYDTETGLLLSGGIGSFQAYASNVKVGLFIAVGDVNDDGFDDIITSVDAGGGPHVKVFSGDGSGLISEFYAYAPNVTVGVRVASGDIDGNGTAEVITAPGAGGGPHIRVFDGTTGMQMPGAATNFYAYAPNVTTGIYVAAGDVNNDGLDDIITAPGAGGGPHVKVFSSLDASLLQNFYAYNPAFTGGVRVGAADLNNDGYTDIITTPGAGGGPHVRAFSGMNLADISSFYSGPTKYTQGLFVGGGVTILPKTIVNPLSSSFVVDSSASETTPQEELPLEKIQKKKSWWDEVDEFYAQSEEIDKLFSGLGIE
ncbi:Hypothetical protein PBC10988_19710 [Planctomycetales bacterium 10988]|nr:Hypothetical protein PBC10988_19710 [Planctomycetales bacterium 10988]